MLNEKDQGSVVSELVNKVHQLISYRKKNEVDLVMCLVELEKLEPYNYIEPYNTYGEVIEGEFGWSEIKYKNAKNMLLSYGAERYREYGKDVLQCMSRLNESGQSEVFAQLSRYKLRKNRVPAYGTVASWVRGISGKFQDKEQGSRVVDIKKKYLEALEEIRNLNKMIREQGEEIARLNIFMKGTKKKA